MRKRIIKTLSYILCLVLVAAVALSVTGCKDNKTDDDKSSQNDLTASAEKIGEGSNQFYFIAYDLDDNATVWDVRTDETTVGAALIALGLIDGEAGPYGLYVKTVNGITVDYDKDGKYWALYVNGDYGMNGVDMTEIESGATYSFKAEK